MPRKPARHLQAVDDGLEPAISATLEALPAADPATARLALLLARTVDEMDADERVRLLPQHIGQLLRVLDRLRPAGPVGPTARLQALRDARAAQDARSGRVS